MKQQLDLPKMKFPFEQSSIDWSCREGLHRDDPEDHAMRISGTVMGQVWEDENDDEPTEVEVGHIFAYRFNEETLVNLGHDLYETYDAPSSDTAALFAASSRNDLIECGVGDMLYIDRIRTEPAYRGSNASLHAIARLIAAFGSGASTVTVIPNPEDRDAPEYEDKKRRLRAWFARLGFVPLDELRWEEGTEESNVMVLDLQLRSSWDMVRHGLDLA